MTVMFMKAKGKPISYFIRDKTHNQIRQFVNVIRLSGHVHEQIHWNMEKMGAFNSSMNVVGLKAVSKKMKSILFLNIFIATQFITKNY